MDSQRKEHAKSTQRREEQAAKDYAARVRHETRPEVRLEGREMFQAQRDAMVQSEKSIQAKNEWVIHMNRTRAQRLSLTRGTHAKAPSPAERTQRLSP